jgi:hypothetical protein
MNFANINIGTSPDDHTGDQLRVAFAKINQNFANIAAGNGTGVNSVAGRGGNVILSVNDVAGAVSVGAITSLVSSALGNISVPTTTQMSTAIATALATAETYANSAVANLSLNAPAGLQTIKQLADAIGDDPQFYIQVTNLRNGLNLANTAIATNTANITALWSNIATQASGENTNTTSINLLNANVAAANSVIATQTTNIGLLNANVTAANSVIATQTTNIGLLNANVIAANLAITSLQSNAASQESEISGHTSSISALNAGLTSANANIATHTTNIGLLNANVTAANLAISALQSNASSQESRIGTNTTNIGLLNANVTAANLAISALQSTEGTHTSQIAQVNANVTAANTAIVNLQNAGYATTGYVTTQINNLINGAPGTLDTLKQLADAIGDDAQFTSHYVNTVTAINANITAANAAIALTNGTVATLNTDITNITNQLATGNITTTGTVSANKLITTNGIFWANGVAFVSGTGQAVNTGNISFSGYTISTINDAGGNFGITLNPANGGEVHIKSNTGINNTNPAYWLEIGNQTDNNNTGAIAVDFGNANGFSGSTVWTYDWADGTGGTTKHANVGLYTNGNIAQGLITFDALNSPANAITVNSSGINFNGNTHAPYLDVDYALSANSAIVAPNLPAGYNPGFPMYVSMNSESRVYSSASLTEVVAKFVGIDSGNAIVSTDGYGANAGIGPTYETRASRGNITVPAAIQSNDILARYSAKGYGLTKFSPTVGGMFMQAEGPFTDTSYPTGIVFYTTANGSSKASQVGRFSSTGNLLIYNNTPSTSVNTGAITVIGGVGVSGNIYATDLNAVGTVTSNFGTLGNLIVSGVTSSDTPTTGALQVAGGAGIGGNLNVLGYMQAGQSQFNGPVFINSTLDPVNYQGGAFHVQGGAVMDGNVQIGNQLLIGNTAISHQLTSAVINARTSSQSGAGLQYAQAALTNMASNGSADWIAYGDTYPGPSNDHGWVDMGYTGSNFNDPDFTITSANDGYLFAGAVANSGLGGNLVLATDNTGTYNDIVFATGGFYANAEVARFHGNTSTGGKFTVQTDTVIQGNLKVNGTISTPTRSNISVTTATLAPNANATVILTGYSGYAVYAIQTSANAWVSVYSSNSAASSDNTRTITSDPAPNSGVIAEVITTSTAPYYYTPAITGYTVDGTVGIPLRVNNQSNSSQTITVTMTMLKLEG